MEPEIDQTYKDIIRLRRASPHYDRVVHSIDRISSEINVPLRTDATCFLANNITDMIIAPIALQHIAHGWSLNDDTLFRDIEHDLRQIIEAARDAATDRDHQQISATSVIIGLGQIIAGLRISSSKLWGR
jgi:hypothetical protein